MIRRATILFLTFALALCGQPAQKPVWLDAAPHPTFPQWNRVGSSIPKVKKQFGDDLKEFKNRCSASLPQSVTESPETLAVTSRGWTVFKSRSDFHGIVVVSALQDYDGMCRPLGYQDFVFVNGILAGTLSPKSMDSRSDASSVTITFAESGKILSEFNRYTEKDPLCCPSRISEVTYEIQTSGTKPLVVVTNIRTRPSN